MQRLHSIKLKLTLLALAVGCVTILMTVADLGGSAGNSLLSTEARAANAVVSTTPTPADTTPPAVSIISPLPGTTFLIPQSVPIVALATDNVGVTRVEFYDNGVYMGSEDTSPFAYSWAISSANNGAHRWTARAFDPSGNSATSQEVLLNVNITGGGGGGGNITASVETDPVHHSGDAADDPAVWVHPTDPSLSTIIGTDKLGGLAVYDLGGNELYYYADSRPNNVDIRYNFPLGGQPSTIVATSSLDDDAIRLYKVNPSTRGLEYVAARTIGVNMGLYGLCMYHSPSSGKYFVFVNDNSGTVQQWELFDAGSNRVDATRVRTFSVGSTTEGCVADDELSHFYVSEEDVAIWKYGAEPGAGTSRVRVDHTGSGGHLTADIEGLSIYYAGNDRGNGYLIASSQGSNNFVVYERGGANTYLKSFNVVAGTVDEVTYTDGLDVLNFPLGPAFPEGAFIAQDDRNNTGNQNFKLVPWGSVARSGSPQLLVDTSWDPRRVGGTPGTPVSTGTPAHTSTAAVPTTTQTATSVATETPTHTATGLPTATATNVPPTATISTATSTATATPSGGLTTLTFYPEADAYVEEATPNTNRGASASLLVDGSPRNQSFLRFAVSGANGPVVSATLRLFVYDSSVDGPAVYTTTNAWNETAITWNNRPAPGGPALDDRGAVPSGAYIEYSVTRAVGGDGTYSFVLVSTSSDGLDTYSREGSTPPQLVLAVGPTATATPPPPTSTFTPTSTSSPSPTSTASATPSGGVSYYLDDVGGNDANPGTSPSSAWRTLERANSAPLAPGDRLLLRRGGVWEGTLSIASNGSASSLIMIGSYGDAAQAMPVVRGGTSCLALAGSFLLVQGLHLDGCAWAGVEISGPFNRVQNSLITNNAAGVQVKPSAQYSTIIYNQLRDNNRMSVLTRDPGNDDSGAFGVLLQGDYTELAYNSISGSDAFSYDYVRDGSAVEVDGARFSHIHHNLARDNHAFTELSNPRAANNKYGYNVVSSSLDRSLFLVTRGSGAGGPVLGTVLYQNSALLTGALTQGFVCHGGCGNQVLRMRNNIVQAGWKVGYADGPLDEDYNLFYGGSVDFTLGPHSLVADPLFVGASSGDLRLQPSSPAVDRGEDLETGYIFDFDRQPIPQDGDGDGLPVLDMGAFEFYRR